MMIMIDSLGIFAGLMAMLLTCLTISWLLDMAGLALQEGLGKALAEANSARAFPQWVILLGTFIISGLTMLAVAAIINRRMIVLNDGRPSIIVALLAVCLLLGWRFQYFAHRRHLTFWSMIAMAALSILLAFSFPGGIR